MDIFNIIKDFIIGGLIAYILAYTVPRKLNNDRCLKDFFMSEFQDIKQRYHTLLSKIYLGEISAKEIKETLKDMSVSLADLQYQVNRTLDVNVGVSDFLDRTKIKITNTDEMNDQFQNEHVDFTPNSLKLFRDLQQDFNKNIISSIISINSSKIRGGR